MLWRAALLGRTAFPRLAHLGLYGNRITDTGLARLKRSLCARRSRTPSLRTVAVLRNAATPKGVRAFSDALAKRGVEVDAHPNVHESEVTIFGRPFRVRGQA